MTRYLLPVGVLVAFAAVFLQAAPRARADATFSNPAIENQYPKVLNFKVTITAPSDITDVSLRYSLVGRGQSAVAKPKELTPAKNLTVTVEVQVNTGSGYIPVASEFVYHWEATTADGATSSGPEANFFFLPPGKDWKNVKNDFMTIYYYGDREPQAQAFLKAGQETYDRIGKQLLKTRLKQTPVKVVVFATESELEEARRGGATSEDKVVQNCGFKVENDIMMMIPVACGSADRTETLRHEFTHILNDAAGFGTLAKPSSWLDEGTAVYGQTEPGSGYKDAVDAAARANRLIPFAQMTNLTSDARLVNLFYGQAWSMVSYLIDKYGPDKFAQLFATIKSGTREDQALQKVYGFDMAGFEKEYLAAAGSSRPPAATATAARNQQTQPTVQPTTRPSSAQPTRTPTPRPAAQRTSSNGGDDGLDGTTIGIFGAGVLFAMLAVMALLFSMILRNNRLRDERAAHDASLRDTGDWSGPRDT